MELEKRKKIFAQYPQIGALIRSFQVLGFDSEIDKPEDEWCDAMLLPEMEIEFANYILMLPHQDRNTYPLDLAQALKGLLTAVHGKQLFLLAHTKSDLFGNPKFQDPELLRVRNKLQQIIGRPQYDEGLCLESKDIDSLVDIFFWLSRLDPDLAEYIFWVDKAQRFCFFICRYGNVHLLSLCGGKLINEDKLLELGFRVGEDYDQFSEQVC